MMVRRWVTCFTWTAVHWSRVSTVTEPSVTASGRRSARRPVEKDVLEACAQHMMMRRNEGCLDHPYVTAVCVPSVVQDAERALEVFKGFSVTFLDENLGPGKNGAQRCRTRAQPSGARGR